MLLLPGSRAHAVKHPQAMFTRPQQHHFIDRLSIDRPILRPNLQVKHPNIPARKKQHLQTGTIPIDRAIRSISEQPIRHWSLNLRVVTFLVVRSLDLFALRAQRALPLLAQIIAQIPPSTSSEIAPWKRHLIRNGMFNPDRIRHPSPA